MYDRNAVGRYTIHLHHSNIEYSICHIISRWKIINHKSKLTLHVVTQHAIDYTTVLLYVCRVCVCHVCVLVLYLHNVFYIIRLLSKHTSNNTSLCSQATTYLLKHNAHSHTHLNEQATASYRISSAAFHNPPTQSAPATSLKMQLKITEPHSSHQKLYTRESHLYCIFKYAQYTLTAALPQQTTS